MQFADPAVAIAVKKVLGCDEIDAAQLSAVRELYLTGATSLTDLPRFSNLYRLYIRESALKDGEILSTLTQLTELSLDDVSGVKSEHIATLTRLTDLSVCDCGQWTLQPLAGLTRLRLVTLHNLGIEDLTPLKGMTRLELVSLWDNPIRDVSVFKGMKHLHRLMLDWENLADRQALADKRVSAALESLEYADFPENAPPAPKKAGKRNKSMPRLEYLADVHSRVYFCRDAALVRLKGGLDKLVCRDYGSGKRKEVYDLYLDGVPLAKTYIPGCGTCGTRLWAGYGDGLMNQEACLAVRDSLNAGYDGLKKSIDSLAPLVGLMESGLYVVADFDLFPVQHHGSHYKYFWDVPEFTTELHFHHAWAETQLLDAPLFLAPSQRAAQMNPEQVDHYRQRLQEGDSFPRAVALYLNGGVALLLDGHHKAAACAAEGVPVKTTVIFSIEDGKKLEAALSNGKRLYFHHAKGLSTASGPLILRDGQGAELTRVSCLQKMRRKRVFTEPSAEVEWGYVPDEYRTPKFTDYPKVSQLIAGTLLQPDQIRSLIEEEMSKAKGTHDMTAIKQLRYYAELFPDSKWLSASERAWLNRPYEDFFYKMAFEILPEK